MPLFGRKRRGLSEEEKDRYLKARHVAEVEVLKQLQHNFRSGNNEFLRDFLLKAGAPPEVAANVKTTRQYVPWKVYWEFRLLNKAGFISDEQLSEAWTDCLNFYGPQAETARAAVMQAIGQGRDFDEVVMQLVPDEE